MKKHPLVRFFASLKLAVFVILLLATVLAWATILESDFGMKGAHAWVYGQPWFAGVLGLLALNVFCAAAVRYPWKAHQTGFVITHCGILTLLAGSWVTQKWGVDGNMPVVEGQRSSSVYLSQMMVRVTDDEDKTLLEVPMPETAKKSEGNLLTLDFPGGEKVLINTYLPRVVPGTDYVDSSVGVAALEVELQNSRFQISEWLVAKHPEKPAEVNLGPASLTLRTLWNGNERKDFLSPPKQLASVKPDQGILVVKYPGGREARLRVKELLSGWRPLGTSGLELKIDRYFPFAVVEGGQLVSRSNEPKNPAVQILVRRDGGDPEKHTIFAFYPEFNTLHGARSKTERLGVEFQMQVDAAPESLAGVGQGRGRLEFAVSGDELLYRSFGAQGDLKTSGVAKVGDASPTGWMDLNFKILNWKRRAVKDESPRYVEYIASQDGNYLSAIGYKIDATRRPAAEAKQQWLYEGAGVPIRVGGKQWQLRYGRQELTLPFALYLEKFTIGHDPGTRKAASYESQVEVKGDKPLSSVKVSMNEPLQYGGYTFYQASYQMDEGKPPISIFSVNMDPGRWIKYLGSLLITLGAAVMFYMNPHYWGKILGRKKAAT